MQEPSRTSLRWEDFEKCNEGTFMKFGWGGLRLDENGRRSFQIRLSSTQARPASQVLGPISPL